MDFSKLTPEQFKVAEMVVEAAEANKIDANLLLAQAFRESQFKQIPSADPKSDAFGVMQIRPSTAEQNKLGDITDLRTNIFGGARLMKQYLDKYKSPEAALLAYHQGPGVAEAYIKSGGDLKSVGPNGLDYVINIGENGGFGQPAKAEGEGETTKEVSPFEGYESESSKFKKQQEENARNAPPKVNPEDKQGGINAPEVGAIVGAGVNTLLPMLTNPTISPKVDTGKALEANLTAQDKLELARRNLSATNPPEADFEHFIGDNDPRMSNQSLEDSFRESQGELERLKNEQRLAQERLRGLPNAPPPIEITAPPVAPDAASRTKAGASGASNWVRAMGDDVPDVLADQAANMRKDNPRGGQAILDKDMAARQRQADLGLGDYGLTRTESGVQLALPPTTVAERQADIDKQNQASQAELAQRTEQARIQQETQARQLEQQRLAYEADLERLRQERAAAGQRHNEITGQVKTVAPLRRALTKAENDAEIASRKLARAQAQPSAAGRVMEKAGVGSTKIGALPRAGVGAGAGYLGVMSYQEALARFKAGDTSEGVLKALEAGAAATAVIPPAGKGLTKARGVGTIGGLGLGAFELGRRLLKERPPEE